MHYIDLAKTYEKLESTTKKLAKTEILANFLKTVPSEDLPKVVLLLLGKVFPPWAEQEIGVAQQMLIKTIAKTLGLSEHKVIEQFKKTGDLGNAIEILIKNKVQITLSKEELTIEKVFDNFRQIAIQAGAGSQERKMALLAELLTNAKPIEAKYICRTVLEQLRVGLAEGILKDAIAQAFNVSPEEVENAWNFLPDYGEIAKIVAKQGAKGLQKIKLQIGLPCNVLLAEKAPDLKTALDSYENVLLQYKYDGMRSLIHKKGEKIWIFTRRLEDVTNAFPDIVELAKKGLKAKEIIVDGETLGLDSKTGKPIPFQLLSTRIKRKYDIEKAIKEIPVQVNLFDILYLDGKNLFDKPLRERFEILKKNVCTVPNKFRIADSLETKNLEEADKFYKKALAEGHEGLIVKNLDALYVPGRSVAGGWLKVKPTLENLDLAIIGGIWGTGKRAGWIGSLILGARDSDTGEIKEIGMVGTGIKEKKIQPGDVTFAELTKMLKPLIIKEEGHTIWVKPKIIIEVSYEEIQKSPTYASGFALRFPRVIRLRLEKEEPDDLERVKKIYEMQKGKEKKKTKLL
ncbi:MAG: ATP-dependent DNA ligase [Candidatus Nanoarchaeia archaeon]